MVVAYGLRLLLGLTVAGCVWAAGRTDTLGRTLLTGVFALFAVALSQEAAQGLIDAARLTRRVGSRAAEVVLVAGGSAGYAGATGHLVVAVAAGSFAVALIGLALSGRLIDPVFVAALHEFVDPETGRKRVWTAEEMRAADATANDGADDATAGGGAR
jgi:hypothetical protein